MNWECRFQAPKGEVMKKETKLKLHRETLRLLEAENLAKVVAAASIGTRCFLCNTRVC